jgi:antitoxin HigA-1
VTARKVAPRHPGEVLRKEFMKPLGLRATRLAKACGVPRTRIERIARETIGITADTALRLAKVFGTTPEFWLNLNHRYELEKTRRAIAKELEHLEERELKVSGFFYRTL